MDRNVRMIADQRTELSEITAKDKVFTQAELTASVDVALLKASATGQLSLEDYNEVN